jgi:hypothetical protein
LARKSFEKKIVEECRGDIDREFFPVDLLLLAIKSLLNIDCPRFYEVRLLNIL